MRGENGDPYVPAPPARCLLNRFDPNPPVPLRTVVPKKEYWLIVFRLQKPNMHNDLFQK